MRSPVLVVFAALALAGSIEAQPLLTEGFDDVTTLPGAGWSIQNLSSPLGLTSWFQGNPGNFSAHAGASNSYIAATYTSVSTFGTISTWLLTPTVALADGMTLSFYTRSGVSSRADRLQVLLSTNGSSTNVGADANSVGDFTTLLLDINPTLAAFGYPTDWAQFTVTLSGIPPSATGRIAFRYYVPNGGPFGGFSDYIGIDTLTLNPPPQVDLSITKTDGQTTAVPGQPVTYTISVGNAGPADVVGATVTDTLPATLQSATWTCSASAGSGCTASGTGNISDTVDLLSGGTLTYSLTASVDLAATGSLANTATVAAAGTIDPDSSNNSATDTDTLLPPPPMVTPQAATSIGPEGATLNASVNPNGLATNVVFDYGPTVAYGSTTASNSLGSGSSPVATSSTVSGLLCNTQYHFRARATNASGTTNGGDLTFTTTAACKPARVFVSVLGADTNDCSNIATPCRTLNAAVAQVAFAGEVIVTRSGSYAGASITKSVKINAAAGVVAFSGQPVTVDPGAAGVVVIRGLTLKAITPGTGTGLSQLSGSLFVENSVIDGWSTGLNSAGSGRLYVENSTFRNNSEGIHLASSGSAAINGSSLVGNSFGGLAVDLGTVTVTGSTLSENGHGVFLDTGAVTLDKTQLANNATAGVLVAGPALARLTRCVVSGNGVGLNNGGGTLEVDGSNAVRGNTTNTSGTITTTSPQ